MKNIIVWGLRVDVGSQFRHAVKLVKIVILVKFKIFYWGVVSKDRTINVNTTTYTSRNESQKPDTQFIPNP